ncbi:terminal nucleotidyltransferase 4B isoform X3 [Gossypium hirsutum]|uniref:Terminal nucleotidyltransferase 4B isoform X3 n=1 Tax=Gossypium hirsutum TaxID=3635 RepID=A0A1U8PWI1_GOSHI|nr:terminal nucleotidyltransferase 4B isoform X3 [Gossypium hirsutum]
MLWVLRQIGHILILPTMMGIAEIVDFCDFLSPTPEEQAAPMQLCILFLMLSSTYGLPAGQKFLGRSGQGFIHQQVILIDSRVRYKKSTDWFVCSFQGIISKGNCKKDVTAKARMPIIKFVKKKSGVAFDISFDVDNGPKAAEFIKEAVLKWPQLRPLCLILKVFLQQRDLNEYIQVE